VPKAAIVVTADHVEMRHEAGLAAASLWDVTRHVDPDSLPKSTRIWVDQVKRNNDRGLAAAAGRKMVNAKMLEIGIAKDYRDNLY